MRRKLFLLLALWVMARSLYDFFRGPNAQDSRAQYRGHCSLCMHMCSTRGEESPMPRAHHPLPSLKAEDMMPTNPVTVNSTSTVQDAVDLMVAADIRHLPVVRHGILVGMISDRDLHSYMLPRPEKVLHADEAHARMAASISEVMRADVITVRPDTPLAALLDILLQEKIGAVPVLTPDTGELLGMVSYIDALRAIRPFV